jgi:hypothetical protein
MLPEYIKSGKFLPSKYVNFESFPKLKFIGTDNEYVYNANLEKMTSDWVYRNTPVTYTLNSDGYRTDEFSTIDWRNSIVLFGCSHVFGMGVDDSATLSSQLQRLTGIPVVNMGLGGVSMTHAFYNQLILSEIEPNPLAVVNIWTVIERMCAFMPDRVINHGHWDLVEEGFDEMKQLEIINYKTTTAATHSYFARLAARNLWKDTKHYECSYISHTAEHLNIPLLVNYDEARDCAHPGVMSHSIAAKQIAQALNL